MDFILIWVSLFHRLKKESEPLKKQKEDADRLVKVVDKVEGLSLSPPQKAIKGQYEVFWGYML